MFFVKFLLTLLAATALTVAAYYPGLAGGFTFDDSINIHQNPAVHLKTLTTEGLVGAAFSKEAGPLYRPIPMLSLALNFYGAGLSPFPYKVANLILHIMASFALFLLCLEILRVRAESSNTKSLADPSALAVLALLASSLFACHPYNLTSVLYIVQRMTVMSALFSMLALWSYLRLRRESRRGIHSILSTSAHGAAASAFAVLAVLSKENALVLLLLTPLLEAFTYKFRRADGTRSTLLVAFALMGVIAFFLAMGKGIGWTPESWAASFARRPFGLVERLLTEGRVVVAYLFQTVLPRLPGMALYHDDFQLSTNLFSPITTLFSWLLIAALGLLALWPKVSSGLRFGIAWFLLSHVLESTVIPLEIMHEHRNYLPCVGLFIGLAATLAQYSKRLPENAVRYCGMLVVGILALLTHSRSWTWSDPITHAYTEAAHHPMSYRSNYGAAYASHGLYLMSGETRHLNQTLVWLDRAAELDETELAPFFEKSRILLAGGVCPDPALYDDIERRLGSPSLTIASINYLQSYAPCMATQSCVLSGYAERIYLAAATNPLIPSSYRAIAYDAFSRYLWLATGDTRQAIDVIARGRELAPEDITLQIHELEYLLLAGHLTLARERLARLDVVFNSFSTRLVNLQAYRHYLTLRAGLNENQLDADA